MNLLRIKFLAGLFVFGAVAAQAQSTVQFDINLPNYDVVYIADLFDIRTQTLTQNLPEMSITIRTPSPSPLNIYLRLNVELQLRGGARTTIVQGQSSPFVLDRVMRLSARDLAGRGATIRFPNAQWIGEDSELSNKIKNHVENFPTLPVGSMFIRLRAFNAADDQPLSDAVQHVISIRNSSEAEVVVSLVSPEHQANVPTPFPTFSWTSQKPNVTLYVYEMLPIHRSPEEAVTGLPYLKRDMTGVSTFTYPPDAERRLEFNKRYLWFVETKVLTTRGDLSRRSDVRTFRVRPETGDNALARLLSSLPGNVSGQLAQLIQDGWVPSSVTLDGKTLNQGELTALFQKLARENTEVGFRVE